MCNRFDTENMNSIVNYFCTSMSYRTLILCFEKKFGNFTEKPNTILSVVILTNDIIGFLIIQAELIEKRRFLTA